MDGRWVELGDGVFARRHRELDLTTGLVLGRDRALVIDTRGDVEQGAELAAAVRELTAAPLVVAITHAHFDHYFGTAAFGDVPVLAHQDCAAVITATADEQRRAWAARYREAGDHATAAALTRSTPVIPRSAPAELDLGGRTVALLRPGRGHTDHDLVVEVVDAGVTFAGDLVEQGAPPSFDDAFPLAWTETLDRLLDRSGPVIVPGHGDVVDPGFVSRQRTDIAEVAHVATKLPAGASDQELEWAANRLAVGGPAGYLALRRAQEELTGLTSQSG